MRMLFGTALSLSTLSQDLTRTVIRLKCRFSVVIGLNPVWYAYSLFPTLWDLLSERGDYGLSVGARQLKLWLFLWLQLVSLIINSCVNFFLLYLLVFTI